MPAQSPTLSPTLSAITAGLRGSSSGIPASTLPTRSAPTSAPLVKIPPPRRAKMEISEPPKARPTSECSAAASPRAALTYQVGAHIGSLGEDTAAQACENGDQRAAEGQAHE